MSKHAINALAVVLVAAGFGTAPGARAAEKEAPAADAQWTILCQTFEGPQHAQQARQAKEVLAKATKLPDWYVVASESGSSLYYGFYRTYDDPKDKDTARAQRDLRDFKEMRDTAGGRPFKAAHFVSIAGSDPVAPPEWDLRNAKGYFSLQIAAYMDSPQRKQAAVDAVRDARAQGVEAYYHHGESSSMVCIGAWPRDAIREQESAGGRTNDPDQPLLVSTTPLPASARDLRTKDTGEKVKVLAPKVEILDPTMLEAMKRYPTHSINGSTVVRRHRKDGREVTVEDPSFLVFVPEKQEVVKQDPELARRAVELGVAPTQQPSQPKRGAGQLKSIGD